MNTKYLNFIVSIVILIAAGCRVPPKSVLSAEPTSLSFSVEGGSKSFTVTSNVYWTISSPPAWIDHVSPTSGNGVGVVTVTVKANTTDGNLINDLVITATDVPDVKVSIRQDAPEKISINEIRGITYPAAGAEPVKTITATDQFTGTVTWTPNHTAFVARQVYTVTITLTAKAGFMFAGVAANFFEVAGATATNSAGSGEIKAVFPAVPDGSENYPFLIANATDLQKIGKEGVWTLDKHYRQTANIDLKGVNNWTPIGSLTGSYDGDGYSIANLTISSNSTNQGLFASIGSNGKLRNVALINVNIHSTGTGSFLSGGDIGAISGSNRGTIENCYVTGKVSGTSYVGGVTGGNNGGVITNCYTACNVTGSAGYIGGIAGGFSSVLIGGDRGSKIAYCYATGNISGTNNVGGILGRNSATETVERCVALSKEVSTSAGTAVGRITSINDGALTSNYGRSTGSGGMTITANGTSVPITSSATDIHGSNATAANTHQTNSGTWWRNTPGFSTDFWDCAINSLPHLKTTKKEVFKETQTTVVN